MANTSVTFSGLVLHYTCDDMVTTDSSGNNNTGILVGSGTTLSAGLINNKLTFDGNGYINFTDVSLLGLAFSSDEMSVSCWVKTTQTSATILSLRSAGNTNTTFDFVIGPNPLGGSNDGTLSIGIRDDGGLGTSLSGTTPINNGSWHHVAVTRAGNKIITLYVDGISIGNKVDGLTSALTPNVAGSAIGFEQIFGGGNLIGDLDDVQIYNRALTPTEITSILSGGAPAYKLSAVTRTFAFTRIAATLRQSAYVMPVTVGAFTSGGADTGTLLGKVLQQTTSGTFTFTGIASGYIPGRVLGAAPAAAFVFTGPQVGLSKTGAPSLLANSGVLTLTGSVTGLLSAHVLPVDLGAFYLTGNQLGISTIVAEPTLFMWSYHAAILGVTIPRAPPMVLNMGRKVWMRPGRWC